MTTRQQRRAAERRARKLGRKENNAGPLAEPTPGLTPEPEPSASGEANESTARAFREMPELPPAADPPSPSPARLAANRANALLSTGPSSPEGKANSSKNALKTGLTGRTVLLPSDDAERYARHLSEYRKVYRPAGERETEVVQLLADTWWRLERILGLEEALYCQGYDEFAGRVADLDPQARLPMLRMHTYLAYERQFRNLQLQERRLVRQSEKLEQQLKELQQQRKTREKEDLERAAALYAAAQHDRRPFDPASHGFDFSLADIEAYLCSTRAPQLSEKAIKNGAIPPSAGSKAA